MTEIQGKSILVRVSARFELARVRVIGSRMYMFHLDMFVNALFTRYQMPVSSLVDYNSCGLRYSHL